MALLETLPEEVENSLRELKAQSTSDSPEVEATSNGHSNTVAGSDALPDALLPQPISPSADYS